VLVKRSTLACLSVVRCAVGGVFGGGNSLLGSVGKRGNCGRRASSTNVALYMGFCDSEMDTGVTGGLGVRCESE
jgi:hypothetical protein